MVNKIKTYGRQTFASLSVYNYRLYFIGQSISLCGTWMQTIGQAWLVLKLTNSGAQLGLVTAMQFIPILFFGPWAGVLVDRFSKRRLLYFTQSAFGVLALVLGILVATGAVQLWMVYILAFLLGIVTMLDNPTRQTFIVEMVGEDQLRNAVALNSSQFNLARVVGPAIGGGLIATVGLAPCFIINAVSYVAVLIALMMMQRSQLHRGPLLPPGKGQLKEGFNYIKSKPILRDTLIMMAIIGTLTYEFSVILPLLAQFTFKGGAGAYAALTAAMGFGAMFGGLYSATRTQGTASSLIKTALGFGLVILLAAIMPNLILAIVGLVAVGFFSVSFTSLGNVTLQLESSPQMRGRVMALWAVAFLGSTPIGGPIIGYIGQYANPRWGLATGGLAAVFAAALGYWRLTKDREKNLAGRIS